MSTGHSFRVRFDWVKTKMLRSIRPQRLESDKLPDLIRKKIRNLGRQYEDGNSNCIGYTYHPIYFDEFSDISCHRGESACRERLDSIDKEVQIESGDRVLDIGANVGFFAFSFAAKGAVVDAIEAQAESFEIGAALSRQNNANVYYVNKPISVKVLDDLDHHYKIALLLSVLHWVMKQEGKRETIKILRAVVRRADTVFLEVPADPSDGMVFHEEFSNLDNVRRFLSEALPDHEIKEILRSKEWGTRPLFKISNRA